VILVHPRLAKFHPAVINRLKSYDEQVVVTTDRFTGPTKEVLILPLGGTDDLAKDLQIIIDLVTKGHHIIVYQHNGLQLPSLKKMSMSWKQAPEWDKLSIPVHQEPDLRDTLRMPTGAWKPKCWIQLQTVPDLPLELQGSIVVDNKKTWLRILFDQNKTGKLLCSEPLAFSDYWVWHLAPLTKNGQRHVAEMLGLDHSSQVKSVEIAHDGKCKKHEWTLATAYKALPPNKSVQVFCFTIGETGEKVGWPLEYVNETYLTWLYGDGVSRFYSKEDGCWKTLLMNCAIDVDRGPTPDQRLALLECGREWNGQADPFRNTLKLWFQRKPDAKQLPGTCSVSYAGGVADSGFRRMLASSASSPEATSAGEHKHLASRLSFLADLGASVHAQADEEDCTEEEKHRLLHLSLCVRTAFGSTTRKYAELDKQSQDCLHPCLDDADEDWRPFSPGTVWIDKPTWVINRWQTVDIKPKAGRRVTAWRTIPVMDEVKAQFLNYGSSILDPLANHGTPTWINMERGYRLRSRIAASSLEGDSDMCPPQWQTGLFESTKSTGWTYSQWQDSLPELGPIDWQPPTLAPAPEKTGTPASPSSEDAAAGYRDNASPVGPRSWQGAQAKATSTAEARAARIEKRLQRVEELVFPLLHSEDGGTPSRSRQVRATPGVCWMAEPSAGWSPGTFRQDENRQDRLDLGFEVQSLLSEYQKYIAPCLGIESWCPPLEDVQGRAAKCLTMLQNGKAAEAEPLDLPMQSRRAHLFGKRFRWQADRSAEIIPLRTPKKGNAFPAPSMKGVVHAYLHPETDCPALKESLFSAAMQTAELLDTGEYRARAEMLGQMEVCSG